MHPGEGLTPFGGPEVWGIFDQRGHDESTIARTSTFQKLLLRKIGQAEFVPDANRLLWTRRALERDPVLAGSNAPVRRRQEVAFPRTRLRKRLLTRRGARANLEPQRRPRPCVAPRGTGLDDVRPAHPVQIDIRLGRKSWRSRSLSIRSSTRGSRRVRRHSLAASSSAPARTGRSRSRSRKGLLTTTLAAARSAGSRPGRPFRSSQWRRA